MEGEQKDYYDGETKILKRRQSYLNGKATGVEQIYYPSGTLKSETTYQKGFIRGLIKTYFENGILQSSGNQSKNRKVNIWKYYNVDGELVREELYRNGKLVEK